MNRIAHTIAKGASLLALVGVLASCAELKPHRAAWETSSVYPPSVTCNPNPADFRVSASCANRIWEYSRDYDLLFTEFTDQGLQYPVQELQGREQAAYQINHTIDALDKIIRASRTAGISLIVYVHGWQHSANSEDRDVKRFREILQAAAQAEVLQAELEGGGPPYRVVGVYVGWRGRSLDLPLVDNLSFWNRKEAASRVALGSTRELFNRLRNFRCEWNRRGSARRAGAAGDCVLTVDDDQPRARVSTMMVGHSFGAWILYNALAGSLVETLIQPRDARGQSSVNLRYADLVVLLNPAFEAASYTPLHRVAAPEEKYYRPSYHPPMLVSVTSSADWATRVAHPLGRFFSSLNESTVGVEENVASGRTMGHMIGDGTRDDPTDYVTHLLTHDSHGPETCVNWRAPETRDERVSQAEGNDRAKANLTAEIRHAQRFINENSRLLARSSRRFCGGATLTHRNHDPNSVVWNVRSNETIMTGHNDVMNDNLIDFLRQIYIETAVWPWRRLPATSRPAR